MSFKSGERVDSVALTESLRPGSSTKPDVLAALGEPRGYGEASLAEFGDEPRTVWMYEMTRASYDGEIEIDMALLFFEGQVYEGHLWFTSLEKLQPGGR